MDERQRELAENLHRAWPIGGEYVTHAELTSELEKIELKIENSVQRQRNWLLGGCMAIILSFGGGYVSLVSKLDRISDELPNLERIQEGRRGWIARKDVLDEHQDRAIQKADPGYQPMPYIEAPK